jgi:hypothetical protein
MPSGSTKHPQHARASPRGPPEAMRQANATISASASAAHPAQPRLWVQTLGVKGEADLAVVAEVPFSHVFDLVSKCARNVRIVERDER